MSFFAQTPLPPYYAVIFTSIRTEGDQGYGHMAEKMIELASRQSGFLGVESLLFPCSRFVLGMYVAAVHLMLHSSPVP